MISNWEFRSRKELCKSKILSVFEDSYFYLRSGKEGTFVTVDTSDWVTVVPVTPEGSFIMVNQYRFGSKRSSLEFPGGVIDIGIGSEEDAVIAGGRELTEETGYISESLELLSVQNPNPAFMTNTFNIVLARGCTPTGGTSYDEFEDITSVQILSQSEVVSHLRRQEVYHSLMYSAFLSYLIHDGQL